MTKEDPKYGIPEQKKFPMPDAKHVRSAIKFFNYVTPKYEKELARAILERMKEYGMSFNDFTVGEENRFSKYIPKDELEHHGILGQKWGIRRYQNADGSLTAEGKVRYYSKETNKNTRKAVKNAIAVAGLSAAIGDAISVADVANNVGGIVGSAAKGMASIMGESALSQAYIGAATSFNVANTVGSFLGTFGEMAVPGLQALGIVSLGFTAYRTGKAIYSGVKKQQAKKNYMDL